MQLRGFRTLIQTQHFIDEKENLATLDILTL